MSHWVKLGNKVDIEVLEESALAMAQSTIQNAMDKAGIARAALARKMVCNRSFVTTMLSGEHNLTVRTMARALAACGCEVRFNAVPIEWNWQCTTQYQSPKEGVPVSSGTTTFIDSQIGERDGCGSARSFSLVSRSRRTNWLKP